MTIANTSSASSPALLARQLLQAIAQHLADADRQAIDATQITIDVQKARLAQLQRTVSKDPAAAGQVDGTQTLLRTLTMSLTEQKLATPVPPKTGWIVYGNVYDSTLNPVAGNTVYFVDTERNYLSAYGYATTDGSGYFELTVSQTPAAGTALTLQVANAQGTPVFHNSGFQAPAVGSTSYQSIVLPAAKASELPKQIQKVAVPPIGKTTSS